MSTAGGLERAFHAAQSIGCDCLQLFVKNQRQWRAKRLSQGQIDAFEAARQETGLAPVVAHAGYLLNLASPDPAQRRRSRTALRDELRRCEALGVPYLVLHPGSHLDGTVAGALRRVARGLDILHRDTRGFKARTLLETTAGQGTTIGHRFAQISAILSAVAEPERLGVCLDTCHLFAAGYDFRSENGYTAMMDELASVIGLARIKCVHVNDSKGKVGSHLDRHEHIGKGKITKAGFAHFVNDPRFAGVPMILETPKGKDGRGADYDKLNLKRLRSLVRPTGRRKRQARTS
jgi:deoxyribonuclease-4